MARKPRPISMGATIPDRSDRHSTGRSTLRTPDKQLTAPPIAQRPGRARSVGVSSRHSSSNATDFGDGRSGEVKPSLPRKPAHVKAAAALRKAAKKQTPADISSEIREEKTEKLNVSAEIVVVANPVIVLHEELVTKVDQSKVDQSKVAPIAESAQTTEPPTPIAPQKQQALDIKEELDTGKPKDIEEYKLLIREKRRLAREQVEKDAELERVKQLQVLREEEERQRQEEEETLRVEKEQHRLAAEHRESEELKLQLAIEDHRLKREEEARKVGEEEERLRVEREQDERTREEAEVARLEMEERLRKDEIDRLARKKVIKSFVTVSAFCTSLLTFRMVMEISWCYFCFLFNCRGWRR